MEQNQEVIMNNEITVKEHFLEMSDILRNKRISSKFYENLFLL
jgi:hypothetical protein